jgi:hypothetical protein
MRSTRPRAESVLNGIFALYIAGLGWAPFWYGSNVAIAWGINAVVFPGLVILYELSLSLRGEPHPIGIKAIGAPAGLYLIVLAWIGLQTATGVPAFLANPIWGMTAGVLDKPIAATISVDPALTDLGLLRLLTAASAFWLALQLCRDPRRAALLITSVMAIGCAYAIYGLMATKIGQLPWLDIPVEAGVVTSTFVNHNSFAAYAGIGAIAATGLALHRFNRRSSDAAGGWRYHFAAMIEASGREGALPLACSFVLLVALLLTGSRGGIVLRSTGRRESAGGLWG